MKLAFIEQVSLKQISCVNLVWILSVVGHKLGVTNLFNIKVGTHSNFVSQVHGDQLPFERPLGGAETHVSFHQFGGMDFGVILFSDNISSDLAE